MKAALFTCLLLVLGCCSSSGNLPGDGNMNVYKKAFQYISQSDATKSFVDDLEGVDVDTPINVADSVVFLEASAFTENIAVETGRHFEYVLDSLMAADSAAFFLSYHVEELAGLGAEQNTPLLLFFSRPRGDVLLAELFYTVGQEQDYTRVATMNRGLLFMLTLGESGSVEESITTMVEYN